MWKWSNWYADKEISHQAGLGHFYHIFYEGCLTDHEVGDDEEASKLYPDVEYTRMDEYLKVFLWFGPIRIRTYKTYSHY